MTQDLGHNEWRPSRVERRLTQRHATAGTDFMEEEMRDNTPRLAGPGQVGLPQEGHASAGPELGGVELRISEEFENRLLRSARSEHGGRGVVNALERDLLLANMPKQRIPEMVNRLLTIHKQWVHPGFF
jgi:hypothetical protein